MTIDEAIEELNRGTQQSRSTNNQRLREALKLGIEALKRISELRLEPDDYEITKLPGETKESHCQGLPLKGITIKVEPGETKE